MIGQAEFLESFVFDVPSNPFLSVLRRPSVKIYIPLEGFLEANLRLFLM